MSIPGRLRERLPKRKSKEELDKHYESLELEKGDLLAMVIAGLITFVPILLIAMAAIYGLVWVFFVR